VCYSAFLGVGWGVCQLCKGAKDAEIDEPVAWICGWLTCDHFVGKASAMGQPTRPTQPHTISVEGNE